ncbi:MAG TPA: hypothetical protein VKY85_09130 [Candidatus Angelobacter sp.]|nr:hypothetical protein [Candidatus Angelobacter sp.]
MTPNTLVLGLGAVLLLVAIIGGGFEIKEFKVPKVGPAPRVLAAIAGMVFIVLGIGLGSTQIGLNQDVQANQDGADRRARPVEFTIYDQLGEGQVTEQVTVLIDGELKGQLTVDRRNPQSMLTVTVPHRGRYSYTIESRTRVVDADGNRKEYPGAGQGMVAVDAGKRFDLVGTPNGNTWLVTLMDGPGVSASRQAQ